MVRYYRELTRLEMEAVDKEETLVLIPVGRATVKDLVYQIEPRIGAETAEDADGRRQLLGRHVGRS